MAVSTVYEFCRAWFEELAALRTIYFLAVDVNFIGMCERKCVHNAAGMVNYMRRDIESLHGPFARGLSKLAERHSWRA